MLIEFSVENHRSIRERQTLSMVASTKAQRSGFGQVVSTGISTAPFVLRNACIFGANGSGKSSLIHAMAFMSMFVRESFRNEAGAGIDLEPFLFHSEWRQRPSEYEAIFVHEDTLYQYGFVLTRERVLEEWLFARPKDTRRRHRLFARVYDMDRDTYDWNVNGSYLKGERDSWKTQTRPDALFLSTAVQLDAEGLKGAYKWLSNHFKMFLVSPEMLLGGYTASRLDEDAWKNQVIKFLKRSDVSLHEIEVKEERLLESQAFLTLPSELPKGTQKKYVNHRAVSINFVRQDETGELVPLPLSEETSGTRTLFEFAGPILDVLARGFTVVVDEINSSLHPLVFQHLVAMFCDPTINKQNAQLIFTTHDTSVTERDCITRDQIWLVEKQNDLATRMIPYSDFKTRDARPFQKAYLQGRYGAVPRVSG